MGEEVLKDLRKVTKIEVFIGFGGNWEWDIFLDEEFLGVLEELVR